MVKKTGRPRTSLDVRAEYKRLQAQLEYLKRRLSSKKRPRRHEQKDSSDKIILSELDSWKTEIEDARKLANEALKIYAALIAKNNFTHAAWFMNLAKGFMQVRHRAMKERDLDELTARIREIEAERRKWSKGN